MAVVDGGSSSSSSSSYEVVICLEVVKTLFVAEILLFFFLGVTRLTVVTSGSMVVLSGDEFGCFRFCGRLLRKLDGNCDATGRTSCCWCRGSWVCATGTSSCTRHMIFRCRGNLDYFYCFCGVVRCDWYDLSYWSLWIPLALLSCRNP